MVSDKARQLWHNLVKSYKGRPISFDFKRGVLANLSQEPPDNYTHLIHSYPAKMFPYIPAFLLTLEELCPPDGVVLDPFCGSGTVLLESLIHPIHRRNVYGVEINPLGRLIAKVKTTPLDIGILKRRIDDVTHLARKSPARVPLPDSEKIRFWFSRRATQELGRLRYSIEEGGRDDDYNDFLWVCFSSIIRKVSKADPFIPPPVVLKLHKYRNSPMKRKFLREFKRNTEKPNVLRLLCSSLEKNVRRIASFSQLREIQQGIVRAQVIWDDAQQMRIGRLGSRGRLVKDYAHALPPNSIDLVLSSPPYLTAQKYIRTQRLEMLWLGLVSEEEVYQLERKAIGSEMASLKEFGKAEEICVRSVDALTRWAFRVSPKRGATLLKYFKEMKNAISEIHRVLKKGGHAVIVIGNNKVLGRQVSTYRLLADIASSLGFETELVLRDEIRGRGMITRRHNTGGLIREEFVVVLRKEG